MKTDDLISMLATGAEPIDLHVVERRYAVALAWGAAGAMLLMLLLLRVRPDLAEAVLLAKFWIKLGFVASLVGTSLFAVLRLSLPGARLGKVLPAIALPVVIMWAFAAYTLLSAEAPQRSALFFGETWKVCTLLIAMLSVPGFVAIMHAMQGLAPTRPRLAGFAAGLLSGAIAAMIYCIHCPEMEAPFIGFWYLLGMLVPAGVGAWIGPSLLRW
ncbi:MAG: DUF1109 domain-containing protein [Formivibrio sp.]|nr:DUF1109 domain-containing protein [Formivibrio sp.]